MLAGLKLRAGYAVVCVLLHAATSHRQYHLAIILSRYEHCCISKPSRSICFTRLTFRSRRLAVVREFREEMRHLSFDSCAATPGRAP